MIQTTDNVSEMSPLLKTRYAGGRTMKGKGGYSGMRKDKGLGRGKRRLARNDQRRTSLDAPYSRNMTRGYGGRQRGR